MEENKNGGLLQSLLFSGGGSGGGGLFWVNFSIVDPKAGTVSSDKTANEIREAYEAGLLVCARAGYRVSTNLYVGVDTPSFTFVDSVGTSVASGRIAYENGAWSASGSIFS